MEVLQIYFSSFNWKLICQTIQIQNIFNIYWIKDEGLRNNLSTVSFNWEDLGGVNEYISERANAASNWGLIIPITNLQG